MIKIIRVLLVIALFSASSVDVATAQAHMKARCADVFLIRQTEVLGYPPELAGLSGEVAHTIKNMQAYLESNLGMRTLEKIRLEEPFVIFEGDGSEVLKKLLADGYQVTERVEKQVGFHEIVVLKRGEQTLNAVLRVNGQDRILHLQSFFKLAGAKKEAVKVVRGYKSWKADYLRTFKSLGTSPDLIVYGLPYHVAQTLLEKSVSPGPMRASRLVKGATPNLSEPDINGRSLLVFELENGKKIWLMPPLYGDLASEFFEAAFTLNTKVLFLGTAGGVQEDSRLGKWFQPSSRTTRNLKTVPSVGRHLHVATANIETRDWARETAAKGVQLVDAEFTYAEQVAKKFPPVDFRAALVLSDILQGSDHVDFTETRIGDIPGLQHQIQEILGEYFNLEDPGTAVKFAASVPFTR